MLCSVVLLLDLMYVVSASNMYILDLYIIAEYYDPTNSSWQSATKNYWQTSLAVSIVYISKWNITQGDPTVARGWLTSQMHLMFLHCSSNSAL